jgi:hypothetical protein
MPCEFIICHVHVVPLFHIMALVCSNWSLTVVLEVVWVIEEDIVLLAINVHEVFLVLSFIQCLLVQA